MRQKIELKALTFLAEANRSSPKDIPREDSSERSVDPEVCTSKIFTAKCNHNVRQPYGSWINA